MKRNGLIKIAPIGLLSAIGLLSIIQVLTTDFEFEGKQYIGLTLLGVSLILFFTNRRVYKYLFGMTLLLGIFNLIGFTTSIVTMTFIFVPIQLIVIPFFLAFTWLNKEQLQRKLQSILATSEEQNITESQTRIAGFRRRFDKLPNDEIEAKLKENLVPEALQALQELKDFRLK